MIAVSANTSTLERFELIFDKVLARNRAAVQKVADRRSVAVQRELERIGRQRKARMEQLKSGCDACVEELQELQKALCTRLREKWIGVSIKKNGYRFKLSANDMPDVPNAPLSSSYTYDQGKQALNEAIAYISVELPFFAEKRGRLWRAEKEKVAAALQIGAQVIAAERKNLSNGLDEEIRAIYRDIAALASGKTLAARDRKATETISEQVALRKVSGSIGEGVPYPLQAVKRGHGRLIFQCGWTAHLAKLNTKSGTADMGYTPLFVPCLIDLLQDHGFLTNNEAVVRSFILRMLHTLPSGSVTFSVYDPKTMGDFVKYLYPLGDKLELILGKDGVRSTPNQLQTMLEETEQHISIINQKYLAGKYQSLVDYNKDAGISFEPYRVLVINDNPASWAASYRQELVSQLERIIDAGSRCGVFVIVNTTVPCKIGLPILFPGQPNPTAKFAARPCMTATHLERLTADEVMHSGSLSGCYALAEVVVWSSADDSWFDSRGQEEIISTLEKELQNARTIEVFPKSVESVSKLYLENQTRKGIRFGPPVVEIDDPASWWRESSIDGIIAYVGIDKANQKKPRAVTFRGTPSEFGALVGGQSRSGKSTFIHTLISELVRRYSPEELELYMVDVKFGAEFKHYADARLPHARVVALESGAEFALSVLQDIVGQMAARYTLFKQVGVSKIDDYRRKTRQIMPRILAVIDEFSGMFEVDNGISEEAVILLTKLIQQGSAAGIHLLLASQSLATAVAIPRNVLHQIPQRVVFKVPEQDSMLFLADDNLEGGSLNRAGEGIYNSSNGRKDANEGFQGTLTTHPDLKATLKQVSLLARAKGCARKPVILENAGGARWTRETVQLAKLAIRGLDINLPVGMPLNLGPCVCVTLEQTVGGNALVSIHNEFVYIDVISTFALGSVLSGGRTVLLDFIGMRGKFWDTFGEYAALLAQKNIKNFHHAHGKAAYNAIAKLTELAEETLTDQSALSAPIIVIVSGLSRASELNQLSAVAQQFQALLQRGAAAGIHVIVGADSLGVVRSRLGYSWQEPFSTFITGLCGSGDSMELVQDRMASTLENDEQIVLFDRVSGRCQKVRPFRLASFPKISQGGHRGHS